MVKFKSVQSWHLASKFFDPVSELIKYYIDEAWARVNEQSIHTPETKSLFSSHTSELKHFGLQKAFCKYVITDVLSARVLSAWLTGRLTAPPPLRSRDATVVGMGTQSCPCRVRSKV